MRVSDLQVGDRATVLGFDETTPAATSARFRALGFVAGTEVMVERRLPFGGPLVLYLGGAAFALEPEAAAMINVAPGGHP